MLFKNRSTSSDGCPEKQIRSSNRAFRARANIAGSAIGGIENLNEKVEVKSGHEHERDLRDDEWVMRACGNNLFLFFLI
jgi:hypothetical protein